MVKINVKTETKRVVVIEANKWDTVKSLKTLMEAKGLACDDNKTLHYGDLELKDNMTLSDCGIKDEAIVSLSIPRSQQKFNSPDVRKQVTKSRSSCTPFLYWKLQEGCNYGGTCQNKDCQAYKQPIMCHRGFGIINPIDDEHLDEVIKCPGCQVNFQVNEIYFFRCQVDVTFKKFGDNILTKLPRKIVQGKEFWQLTENDVQNVDYIVLRFDVLKLHR